MTTFCQKKKKKENHAQEKLEHSQNMKTPNPTSTNLPHQHFGVQNPFVTNFNVSRKLGLNTW